MASISGVLFYSNKCNYSMNLLKLMHDQGILQYFTQKCVDGMNLMDLSNKMGIQEIPTIVVCNKNSNKSNSQIFEGTQAFEWLENIVRNRREMMIKDAEHKRKLIQFNNMKANANNGFMDFSTLETSGISDSYSYWTKDIITRPDIEDAQPKNFLPYMKDEEYKIIPFDDMNKSKISAAEQHQRTKELENLRNAQDKNMASNIEREHLNAVINAEIGNI